MPTGSVYPGLIIFPVLALLVAGCSLTQKPVVDNSALNQPASSTEAQNDKQTINQTQLQNSVGNSKETDNTLTEDIYVTKTMNFKDNQTGKELPAVTMRVTKEFSQLMKENNKQIGIVAMPSIIPSLIDYGYSDSNPRMRTIGPFYQILPQGEAFGGVINFSFCYFDEDIRGYDEDLFYIAEEKDGSWQKLGGIPNPENNCVDISLENAPDYSLSVYAGIK